MSQCEGLQSNISGDSIINSTYISAGSLNVDGVNNAIPFCRVFSTTSYAVNDSVVWQIWLPDTLQYNGRYVSVGKYLHPFFNTPLVFWQMYLILTHY